jgi:hypothetical protein
MFAAEGVDCAPGGLDEFPPPLLAVGLPAGGAAIGGGGRGLGISKRLFDVHDTQRIRYAGYR